MARYDYYNDPNAPTPTKIVPAASAIVVNDKGEILLHRRDYLTAPLALTIKTS